MLEILFYVVSRANGLGIGFGLSVLLVGSESVHIFDCYVMSRGRKF